MPHRHQAGPPPPPAQGPASPTSPDQEEPPADSKFRPTFQNSYRLEPKRPWSEEAALAALKEVMHHFLDTAEYDVEKCAELANTVAIEIRTRIRELNFDRYKIACIVHIYEKLFQGIHSEVGYLWDTQRDRHISYNFSNTHIIATGTVYGVYYE